MSDMPSPPMDQPTGLPFALDASGQARVAGTRVTLSVLLWCYLRGESPERIHEAFPTVPLSEIHAVISYYLRNREAVDLWLEEKRRHDEEVLKRLGVRHPQPSREELLQRMAKRDAVPTG